jgi:predicted trehalose synthase
MLRSFEHVVAATLREGRFRNDDLPRLEPWARWWSEHAGTAFLSAYRSEIAPARLVPARDAELASLLAFFRLTEAVDDLDECLRDRPERVAAPLGVILGAGIDGA